MKQNCISISLSNASLFSAINNFDKFNNKIEEDIIFVCYLYSFNDFFLRILYILKIYNDRTHRTDTHPLFQMKKFIINNVMYS